MAEILIAIAALCNANGIIYDVNEKYNLKCQKELLRCVDSKIKVKENLEFKLWECAKERKIL